MNEAVAEHDHAVAQQQPSAGALLRHARESAGVHLAALAVSLKVPPRQLEALESDRLELLPDNTFARALAASVCRNLKADPEPVLARLPQGVRTPPIRFREPINEPFRVPGEGGLAPWRQWLRKPPVVIALALLFGALALVVAPSFKLHESLPAAGAEAGAPAPMAGAPVAVEAPAPATVAPSEPQGAQTAVVSAPEPVASTAPAAGTAFMEIQARQDSWVQVTDAGGAALIRRTVKAGEVVGLPAAPAPLAVTVGSAAGVTVLVRGKPLELAGYTRDNVARFEVK